MNPLSFHRPELEDGDALRRIVSDASAVNSDLAWVNLYLLASKYNTEIAIENGILYRHYGDNARLCGYSFPCAADLLDRDGRLTQRAEEALRRIEQDSRTRGRTLRFCLLSPAEKECLESLRPGFWRFHCARGNHDYLYRRSDLAELPGTSYHAKRNHLSRFLRDHGHVEIEPLHDGNADDFRQVAEAWLSGMRASAGAHPRALEHEWRAIDAALRLRVPLALEGTLLRVQGAPAAMALTSFISPLVADVHYEKCHPDFRGAYALINRETAKRLSSANLINREEDLGVEGLRQAKLSYKPCRLVEKWDALPADCKDDFPGQMKLDEEGSLSELSTSDAGRERRDTARDTACDDIRNAAYDAVRETAPDSAECDRRRPDAVSGAITLS